MTTTTGRAMDATSVRLMRESYNALIKAGNDSVQAAYSFGQCLDSFTHKWHLADLAQAVGVSVSTIYRYLRFYRAYQRLDLALEASAQLETYDIKIITDLQLQLHPVEHGRPMAGRRFTYACQNCHSRQVVRAEIDPETLELLEPLAELEAVS